MSDKSYEVKLFLPATEERQGEGGLRKSGYYKKSKKNKPLISVVTIVFNAESYLEETINSVLYQSYDNIEYIVIDGGSTDGTLEIIKKYEDKIDYWVSEKDSGISNAFNKGISLCTGELIGIINADDYYEKNCIEKIAASFDSNTDIIYGKMRYWFTEKKWIDLDATHSLLETEMCLMHPSVFVSQKCYKECGLFLEEYKYAMDYELMLRFFVKKRNFQYLNTVVAHMRAGGTSNRFLIKSISEMRKAQLMHLDRKVYIYISSNLLILRRLISSVLKDFGLYFLIGLYRKFKKKELK